MDLPGYLYLGEPHTDDYEGDVRIDEITLLVPDSGSYVCGDADGSGDVNILDVSHIIAYLYKNGPAPAPIASGDPDGNGTINILDVSYLITYLYKSGPPPVCP
jgi:hypothetical protein